MTTAIAPLDVLVDPLAPFLTGTLSPLTAKAYRQDVEAFLDWLGRPANALGAVNADDIIAYRNTLLAKLKPATVARRLSTLRNFFDLCAEYGITQSNPARASRVKSPRVSPHSNTAGLNRQQAERLLAQPDRATPVGIRDYAILSLMVHTGLRRAEVCAIRLGHLRDKSGFPVLVVTGKGHKERDLKILPWLWQAIVSYIAASGRQMQPESWLFVPYTRRPGWGSPDAYIPDDTRALSDDAVWAIVQRYATRAGLDDITPHSLRHTFITLALAGGAPLHKVQYAAGHADPRTTERYDRDRENLEDSAFDHVRVG